MALRSFCVVALLVAPVVANGWHHLAQGAQGRASLAQGAAQARASLAQAKGRASLAQGTQGRSALAAQEGATGQVPLSDFLALQGTTSMVFPGVADYFGCTGPAPGYPYFVSMDFLGLAAKVIPGLSTDVSGTVARQDVGAGLFRFTMNLHTTNALSFVVALAADLGNAPVLFGARVDQVLSGAVPVLGDCSMHVVWEQLGAQPVDLFAAFAAPAVGFRLLSGNFHGSAQGIILPAAVGYTGGYTGPGTMMVAQTGVFGKGNGNGALADAFPVETVVLLPAP